MADTRVKFHEELEQLKSLLITMGENAERIVDLAVQGYATRSAEMCAEVFEMEKGINSSERHIDDLSIELLAKQQPMAVDLRLITACMKINSDLERIADQACNIAERGIAELKRPTVDLPVDIPRIAAAAAGMIRRALNAFIDKDAELADAVLRMDDIVDRMDDDAWILLVDKMHSSPEVLEQALDAIIVVRNLERVADHATNIAEDVIYWVRGTDVRHRALITVASDA